MFTADLFTSYTVQSYAAFTEYEPCTIAVVVTAQKC